MDEDKNTSFEEEYWYEQLIEEEQENWERQQYEQAQNYDFEYGDVKY